MVVIPDSVTSIGENAFPSCYGFGLSVEGAPARGKIHCLPCAGQSYLVIPNFVTSIGVRAVAECSGLGSVTGDPRLGNLIFDLTAQPPLACASYILAGQCCVATTRINHKTHRSLLMRLRIPPSTYTRDFTLKKRRPYLHTNTSVSSL